METNLNTINISMPDDIKEDIVKAIDILQKAGCKQIFLFGSLAKGKSSINSDIDIAVKGLPKSNFFTVYGVLIKELNHQVDLIDLDEQNSFTIFLETEKRLLRVA